VSEAWEEPTKYFIIPVQQTKSVASMEIIVKIVSYKDMILEKLESVPIYDIMFKDVNS